MNEQRPKTEETLVSVILPCRNEAGYIKKCLDSIVDNGYPRLEVIVVDGMSNDGITRPVLDGFVKSYPFVRVIDNVRKTTPYALNLGIRNSHGSHILWMSGHNEYRKGYIASCLRYMEEYKADAVGGVIRTVPRSDTLIGRSIAFASSSPFGVGNSLHKIGCRKPQWADTAFGTCYKRSVFEQAGLFNEGLTRGQDMEFGLRLKEKGLKTLLVPELVSTYYVRSEFNAFMRHNFTNGRWAILPFKHSERIPVSLRHIVPMLFVAGILALSTGAIMGNAVMNAFLLVMLASYLACDIFTAFQIAFAQKDLRLLAVLPFIFPALHISYGLGSLWGAAELLLSSGIMKRLFDLCFSCLGLIALSSAFLLIGLRIKMEDGGPVFYRGERTGLGGRRFRMIKFRTMVVNADKIGGPSTSGDDPRVMRIGKFLRKFKLDEIPQLINVLRGEMSFVGPRPEVPLYTDMFTPDEARILSVKPGITDWASLWNSDEGAILAGSKDPEKTYMEKIRPEKIRLQMEYVGNNNLLIDAKIIMLTLLKIVKR